MRSLTQELLSERTLKRGRPALRLVLPLPRLLPLGLPGIFLLVLALALPRLLALGLPLVLALGLPLSLALGLPLVLARPGGGQETGPSDAEAPAKVYNGPEALIYFFERPLATDSPAPE